MLEKAVASTPSRIRAAASTATKTPASPANIAATPSSIRSKRRVSGISYRSPYSYAAIRAIKVSRSPIASREVQTSKQDDNVDDDEVDDVSNDYFDVTGFTTLDSDGEPEAEEGELQLPNIAHECNKSDDNEDNGPDPEMLELMRWVSNIGIGIGNDDDNEHDQIAIAAHSATCEAVADRIDSVDGENDIDDPFTALARQRIAPPAPDTTLISDPASDPVPSTKSVASPTRLNWDSYDGFEQHGLVEEDPNATWDVSGDSVATATVATVVPSTTEAQVSQSPQQQNRAQRKQRRRARGHDDIVINNDEGTTPVITPVRATRLRGRCRAAAAGGENDGTGIVLTPQQATSNSPTPPTPPPTTDATTMEWLKSAAGSTLQAAGDALGREDWKAEGARMQDEVHQQQATTQASDAVHHAQQSAQSAGQAAKSHLDNAQSKMSSNLSGLKSGAENMAQQAKDSAHSAKAKAESAAQQAKSDISKKVGEAADSVKSKAHAAQTKAQEAVSAQADDVSKKTAPKRK
ncbi:hypothetical protein GQ42DRAFT_158107 [Ramicandelaber brevisporus]|nr:hypothetical protein GQ42DRAFT_158107 [Ramicandelaber brevisporus]